jgi:hypothetical protein
LSISANPVRRYGERGDPRCDGEGGQRMKYMLAIIGPEGRWEDVTPEEMKAALGRWSAFERDAGDAGVLIAGEGLQESATATTVRFREDDEPALTDGPFAETKEQLGGFYLLECADLDEALGWAKKVPVVASMAIEVRPVMDYTQFGFERSERVAGVSS